MKKIFSLLAIVFFGILLVGCTDLEDSNTLEITSTPSTTYVVGYNGEISFAFKADDVEYKLVWNAGEGRFLSLKVGSEIFTNGIEEILSFNGITITGFDFSTPGVKTLTIGYEGLSARFEYEVTAEVELSGTGKVNDPFIIRQADHLIQLFNQDKLFNETAQNRVYIRLAADLDFSGKSLKAPIKFVTIDGAKPLGGNYKVINLTSSLFGNVSDLTMRNIDVVDSMDNEYIIGGTGNNITIENVNILGESYAGRAGYFNTLTGTNTFINCVTYATIIAADSAGGFIRYASSGTTTFENSFNYGLIQTSKADLVGGLVAQANNGKIIIRNSAMYGRIEIFTDETKKSQNELYLSQNKGIFTLVGTQFSESGQEWVKYNKDENQFSYLTNRVDIDQISIDESSEDLVSTNIVAGVSLDGENATELNLNDITFLEGFDQSDVKFVEITVVHGNAKGHKIENGQLVTSGSSGNATIYKKLAEFSDNKFMLPSLQLIIENAKHPFTSNINEEQQIGNFTVKTELSDNSLGYDIYHGGLYRIANGKSKITVNVFGYNENNELVFIALGTTQEITLPSYN